jgi:hypothetical protein
VLALLIALAIERGLVTPAASRRPQAPRLAAFLAVALGLGIELQRFLAPPVLRLDGAAITNTDPLPADDHAAHRLAVAGNTAGRE